MRQFTADYPEIDREWFENSNYLVCLSVQDLPTLTQLFESAKALGLSATGFFEPDLNDELTAIAVAPSDDARRLLSRLPLALKKAIEHGRSTDMEREVAPTLHSDVS